MKQMLRELFSERSTISSMRVMAMACCLTAILIAIVGLFKASPDYAGMSMLCGTFLGMAFVGKAIQKPNELPADPKK